MRAGVAGDVTAGAEHAIDAGRHQGSVRHRDVRELRRKRGRHADLVVPHLALVPLRPRHLFEPDQATAVAHADLRRAEHEEGVLEARRVLAVKVDMGDGELTRADLDLAQILDVDGAVAGQPRPHEQRDVVAPGDEGLLEGFQLLAPARQEILEALRVIGAKGQPAHHVDAAEQKGGVDAVVDVALVDVALERQAGAGEQVGVARRIDDGLGQYRAAALLALEDGATHGAVLDDRLDRPGMEGEPYLLLQRHLHRKRLQRLRIDRRRPGDDAVIGGRALRPVRGGGGILGAPVGARRSHHRVLGQAIEDIVGDAGDDLAAAPVRHAIDPDDQAAGRQAAEMVVALDQHDLGAEASGGDRRRRAGRPAADDQHVGLGEDRGLARRLLDGQCRARAPGATALARENLDALLAADAAGQVVAAHVALARFYPVADDGSTQSNSAVNRHFPDNLRIHGDGTQVCPPQFNTRSGKFLDAARRERLPPRPPVR